MESEKNSKSAKEEKPQVPLNASLPLSGTNEHLLAPLRGESAAEGKNSTHALTAERVISMIWKKSKSMKELEFKRDNKSIREGAQEVVSPLGTDTWSYHLLLLDTIQLHLSRVNNDPLWALSASFVPWAPGRPNMGVERQLYALDA
ncbi:hypothetical protein LR48_Vigan07g152600 [Vigna angularis]|uniref:Uncharacterized protein n=1 Tax=Phaseolus angularis TaxID=3914 RepID=A0A0L9UZ02_PHAAN|nr:hypothetical protein LR48_Vigan07g152600 [Vigna angularis]